MDLNLPESPMVNELASTPQTKSAQSGTGNGAPRPLHGTGEMADLIRAYDWSRTPLGPLQHWPEALFATVQNMLASPYPTSLYWGTELTVLYNDAYRPFVSVKHPVALGQSCRDLWKEAWNLVGPAIEGTLSSGEAIYREGAFIPIEIGGQLQDAYWTFSFSPVYFGSGIGGVLNTCQNTTETVRAERALRESEQRTTRVLQSIGDAVIVTDAEGRINRMNPVAERLTGWPLAEARGLQLGEVFRIVHEHTRQTTESPSDKVRRLGRVVGLADHTVLIGRDGQDVHIDDSGAPIFDENGMLTGTVLIFRDISERQVAERERNALSAQLQQVLESTTDAVLGLDRNWRINYLNPRGRELVAPGGNVVGKNLWQAFPATLDPSQPYLAHYHRAMEEGIPGQFEAFYPEPLNLWVSVQVRPSLDGIVLFVQDITEKKRMENARSVQEDRQHILFALLNGQRGTDDPAGIMRAACEAIGRYLGADRVGFSETTDGETLYFVSWESGALPALQSPYASPDLGIAYVTEMRAGKSVIVNESRTNPLTAGSALELQGVQARIAVPIHRHGQWIATLFVHHGKPRCWTEDEIQLVSEVADQTWDAVERARVQLALQASEERFRTMFDHAPVGINLKNLDGRLVACNHAYTELTGRSEAELCSRGFIDGTHPDDIEENKKLFNELVAGKTAISTFEKRYLHADGSTVWVRTHSALLHDNAGRPHQVLGIFENIESRKKAESALIQTEKLAAVGRLAASIAHEINNPLESITNLLYLASLSDQPDEIHQFLDVAERELRRVSVISSQTLRFYKQSTSPRPVTCQDLFDSVLSIHQGRLINSGVMVEKRKRATEPVVCFEGEIRQVLNNVIGNAIDAMHPEGGRLSLRSRIATNWRTGRKGLGMTIADTGGGMTPQTRKKLFEAFYTTKGIGGTGLGLWVSKEIVERHGGILDVRTSRRPGHSGTVFYLFLPFDVVSRAEIA